MNLEPTTYRMYVCLSQNRSLTKFNLIDIWHDRHESIWFNKPYRFEWLVTLASCEKKIIVGSVHESP